MIKVREMMNKKVVAIDAEMIMKKICDTLTKKKVTGVPVIGKAKEIIGFVSERDIIKAVNKSNFYKLRAKDIMVKKVHIVDCETPLNEIALIFSSKPYRHLPVTMDGKLIGMISRRDLIDQMLGHYY